MRCVNMLNLAGQLKAGQGLAIVVALVKGDSEQIEDRRRADDVSQSLLPWAKFELCLVQIKKRMQEDMVKARLRGFAKSLIYNVDQVDLT
jgi:hypothetical protein